MSRRRRVNSASRLVVVVRWWLAALLLGVVLVACGPEAPAPTATPVPSDDPGTPVVAPPAKVPGQPAGKLLFVRGGNLWQWQNGQETQLTETCGCKQPRWSPTGDALLYIKVGESFADLYWADANGQNSRQLTHNQAQNLQLETKEYIANSLMISGLTWARTSNNTERVIYSNDQDGGFQLHVMNGLASQAVTVNAVKPLGVGSEGAALSPDGNTVAFVHELIDAQTGNRATQIFLADLNAGTYRALTNEPGGAYDPAWSPDGQWLTYAVRQTKGSETNLWLIHPDGTGRQRLTEGEKDRGAAWSPDGDQLAFVRQSDNGFALFFVDLKLADGKITAGKPIRIGNFNDVDPASGVSWAR